jgi:hypothetical protein
MLETTDRKNDYSGYVELFRRGQFEDTLKAS